MPSPPAGLHTWKVKLTGRKRPAKVVADYYRIGDRGELVFRLTNHSGGYPTPVIMFAHGHWLSVELALVGVRSTEESY